MSDGIFLKNKQVNIRRNSNRKDKNGLRFKSYDYNYSVNETERKGDILKL